jgi:hypothetical protein
MAKPKSPQESKSAGPAAQSGSQLSDSERQRMISDAAYYRAMLRGFQNGNPADDWLAAEREINRLLPSPAQQKRELAAYQKLRADMQKLLADTKDTVSPDTIRQALNDARERLRQLGEHTADTIDTAIASIEKEMIGASQRMGARLENVSERTADVFYIWRDRGNRFLAEAAKALGDWTQEVSARLGEQTYRTGEIAASGELECTACCEHVQLETPAHVPLCPKCRKTEFRRVR